MVGGTQELYIDLSAAGNEANPSPNTVQWDRGSGKCEPWIIHVECTGPLSCWERLGQSLILLGGKSERGLANTNP